MTPYCSVCGEPFQSQTLFDKHRVGKYEPDERRCLTPDEMQAKGWRHDGRTWRGPKAESDIWAVAAAATVDDFFMQEAEPLEVAQ